jgi:hypothetical protein
MGIVVGIVILVESRSGVASEAFGYFILDQMGTSY